MKLALAYHQARGQGGRNVFVSRERAYHGVNFGGVALSGLVNNRRKYGPGLPGHRAHAAHAPEGEPLHAGRGRARRRPGRGPAPDREHVRSGEHRRVLRRADRRFDGLPRAAQGLSQAPARDLRRARHPARVRRGDHRLRPDGPDVRRAELRRHAGHHDDGEGDHQRRAADGRGRGERAHPRHDHGRGARGRDRVLPRLHVLGPSRVLRGRHRDARHLPERGPVRARPRAVARTSSTRSSR